MIFEEEKILLKNGGLCTFKSPGSEDAEEFLEFLKVISGETNFMTRYPEEVTYTIEEEQKLLEDQRNKSNCLSISGVIDGKIVANGTITCLQENIRFRHRAGFGIGIKKEFWGLGIGSIILENLINRAKDMGFEQIELGVISGNKRGISLYEKYGFQIYGIRKKSFKYKDESYGDEILMVLEL